MREIEGKYKIGDFYPIREKLFHNSAKYLGKYGEVNTLLDIEGFFERRNSIFRIRHIDDKAILTVKGKAKRGSGVNNRLEFNVRIPNLMARIAARILDETGKYEKIREDYTLEGCVVSLDYVEHLGSFVEIEGKTASAVKSLKDKLEIAGDNIEKSYLDLIREQT